MRIPRRPQPELEPEPAVDERLPSDDLRLRVAGTTDPGWFVASGRRSVEEIERMLAIVGTGFSDYARILDFGCGPGRILLHLEQVGRSAQLTGTDVDAEAVAWAEANIPYARVVRNDPLPPLPLDDASVDLVFNHSVFTHIDAVYQDAWLGELRRVTAPGGVVLLTVNGAHSLAWHLPQMPDDQRDASEREFAGAGFVFLADDWWSGGPYPDYYHTSFHAPWYLFRHWPRFFDVLAYVPRGSLGLQDFVLLRRPEE